MTYRVSTMPDGTKRWWQHPKNAIPADHTDIRPATDEEVEVMDAILKADAEGSIPEALVNKIQTMLNIPNKKYRISTSPEDTKNWWTADAIIPTTHRFIRPATDEETVIIDEILKEDALGKMPSARWGRLITLLMNKWRMYVLFTGGNNIFLTGPFRTYTEAGDYGAIAEKRLWNNDPNWVCIELSYLHGLRVDEPVDFDTEPQKYIVVTRETEVYLVGPFADSMTRRDYGATAQKELWEDDPHWKTIDFWDLSETKDLRIETPADIKVVLGAYNLACGLNANGSKIDHEASDKGDLEPLLPLKHNDTFIPSHMIADGIIAVDQQVNLFDMTLSENTIGYQVVDWTDTIAEGGSIESLLIEVTRTSADGPTVVELFSYKLAPLTGSEFISHPNVEVAGARVSDIHVTHLLTNEFLMSNGETSSIFTKANDIHGYLVIRFSAELNLRTSYARGMGSIFAALQEPDSTKPSIVKELTFKIIGWKPRLFFTAMTTQKELTPDDAFLISEEAAARMAKTDNIECKVTVRYDAKGIPPASIYPDDYNNNPVK